MLHNREVSALATGFIGTLHSLDLSGNGFTDTVARKLSTTATGSAMSGSTMGAGSGLNGLKRLVLRETKVSDTALVEILSGGVGRTLTALDVSGCRGVADGALRAVAAQCVLLKRLELNDCVNVGDKGVDSLVESKLALDTFRCSGCKRITDHSMKVSASKSLFACRV